MDAAPCARINLEYNLPHPESTLLSPTRERLAPSPECGVTWPEPSAAGREADGQVRRRRRRAPLRQSTTAVVGEVWRADF